MKEEYTNTNFLQHSLNLIKQFHKCQRTPQLLSDSTSTSINYAAQFINFCAIGKSTHCMAKPPQHRPSTSTRTQTHPQVSTSVLHCKKSSTFTRGFFFPSQESFSPSQEGFSPSQHYPLGGTGFLQPCWKQQDFAHAFTLTQKMDFLLTPFLVLKD